MNDAFGMGRIQCVGNVDSDGEDSFQIECPGSDQRFQRHAFQILHGDERLTLVLANLINCADIRMIQRRSGLCLTPKSFQHLLVLGKMARKELQGDKTMERNVLRLVDDTHAATPDRLDDAVMRDGSPEQGGRVRHFALILGGTARQVKRRREDTVWIPVMIMETNYPLNAGVRQGEGLGANSAVNPNLL